MPEGYVSLDISNSTSDHEIFIVNEIFALKDEIISNRRWFHSHPELSFQEFQTAAKVVELLKSYGITEIYEGIGRTGIVGIIHGEAGEGPTIGLRADMDALPLQETATIDYKSLNPGVMHACGHDGHVSGLLAAAKVLFQEKSKLKGIIKLVFQPAEEGYGGAQVMIDDGVLDGDTCGPKIDEIYGIHLWSVENLGNIGCKEGPVMAASDRFEIKVKGKGGHGAAPQGTVDAIVEAAYLITSLQTIISRNLDPIDTGVITCGKIKGGYAYNIIADEVDILGTCRSYKPATQELLKSRIDTVCCGIAHTYGGAIDFQYHYGYPPTVNAYPECVKKVIDAGSVIVGPSNAALGLTTMGAEDFSLFLQKRPGCFFFVGGAKPGEPLPHHKSVFDFDERALLISASVYVQLIRNLLG